MTLETTTRHYIQRPATPIHLPPEWQAALHVLDSPLLRRKGCRQYVDLSRREINFPALLQDAAPWSPGERLLAKAAWSLYNGGCECDLGEAARRLDDGNLAVVLEALRLFRS